MDDATRFRMLTKYVSSGGYREWCLETTGADLLHVNLYDAATGGRIGRQYSAAMTAYQGIWVHVAATYTGSETSAGIRLYLNGVRVDNTDDNSGSYSGMPDIGVPLNIGGYESLADYADGAIDEVRIYGRTLSASEISTLFAAGRGAGVGIISSGNLALYMPFTSAAPAWSEIAQLAANTQAYTDTNLIPGTKYHYRVKATSSQGVSDYSDVVSILTPGSAPTTTTTTTTAAPTTTATTTSSTTTADNGFPVAPGNLIAIPVSSSQINLTWTDHADNETGFVVEHKAGHRGAGPVDALVDVFDASGGGHHGVHPQAQMWSLSVPNSKPSLPKSRNDWAAARPTRRNIRSWDAPTHA